MPSMWKCIYTKIWFNDRIFYVELWCTSYASMN